MTLLEHRTRETSPSTGLFVRGMRLTGHTFKVSKKIHSNRGCSALFPQVAGCSWTLVATGAGKLCLRHVWCEGLGLDRHMLGELGTHHDRKLLIWRHVLQNRRRSNTHRRAGATQLQAGVREVYSTTGASAVCTADAGKCTRRQVSCVN